MSPRVSAIFKTKNEAHQIREAIDAARSLADEIVVVDDFSDDDTVAVAHSCGARVLMARSVDGRIDALDKIGIVAATGDWILRLDADERLTPSLAAALRRLVSDSDVQGVAFARCNFMFGDWPRHGGWFKANQLRFFRRESVCSDWSADLHSQVPIRGNIRTLPARASLATLHYDYRTVNEFTERTLWRYSRTDARHRYHAGQRFSVVRLIVVPPKVFIGRLLLRGGFLDGRRGVVLAALLAAYRVAIECHLWDLERLSE